MSINELINQSEVGFIKSYRSEIYIGINDNPRQIIGLSEEELPRIEEQISNLIYDNLIRYKRSLFFTIEDNTLLKCVFIVEVCPLTILKIKGS